MKAFNYCTAERYQFCYLNLDMGRPHMFKNFTEDITQRFFPNLNGTAPQDLNNTVDKNKKEEENIKEENNNKDGCSDV